MMEFCNLHGTESDMISLKGCGGCFMGVLSVGTNLNYCG